MATFLAYYSDYPMQQLISKSSWFILPILLVFLVYAPALEFGKIWDDWLLVGSFAHYQDPAQWIHTLTQPLPFSINYFRPLVILTFLLESYFGCTDLASHIINIAIHSINSLLLGLIALSLWPAANIPAQRISALCISLIYALHPAMVEGVVWIAGRFDLLATTFVLLAIFIDSSARTTYSKAILISFCFILALLCKEMAVTLPVILFFLHLVNADKRCLNAAFSKDKIIIYLGLCIGLTIYLAVRYYALGYLLTPEEEMAFVPLGSPLQRVLLIGTAFSGYLGIIFVPFSNTGPLHYTDLPIATSNPAAWFGLVAFVAIIVLSLWTLRHKTVQFSAICFLAAMATLLPVLHFLAAPMLIANTLTIDRAVMLPLALILLGLGSFCSRIVTSKGLMTMSLSSGVWVMVSFVFIRVTLPIWSSDYQLWRWLSTSIPYCSLCHSNFAKIQSYTDGPISALKEADTAFASASQPWQSAFALSVKATALSKLDRLEDAVKLLEQAAQLEPAVRGKVAYKIQKINYLITLKKLGAAQEALTEIISLGGRSNSDMLSVLGKLALATDRPDLARIFFQEAYSTALQKIRDRELAKTDDPKQWTRLGDMFTQQHNEKQAAFAYAEAKHLNEVKGSAIRQ